MNDKHLVAVYGTLRQGEGNYDYFLKQSTKLGEFDSDPEFTMYSVGGYPALVKDGSTSIKMEVFEVDNNTLSNIDNLEGYNPDSQYGNHYDRITINTPWGNAYLYVYEEHPNLPVIEEGDWIEYRKLLSINRV